MIFYLNIYPDLPLGRGEPCLRTFLNLEEATYARYSDCLGTYMINTQTKEAKEIIPSPNSLDTTHQDLVIELL